VSRAVAGVSRAVAEMSRAVAGPATWAAPTARQAAAGGGAGEGGGGAGLAGGPRCARPGIGPQWWDGWRHGWRPQAAGRVPAVPSPVMRQPGADHAPGL